ncbi:hypothetical protein [Moraxella porci]|uniref:hypothetical protein n=1 Tax=Moraxella porci TaxID=1288392 RepID=UPI002447BCDC|nr:hypothetical protein [Moraxella porci]MDH2273871.1 hypothetical protein [Moraxella porci]
MPTGVMGHLDDKIRVQVASLAKSDDVSTLFGKPNSYTVNNQPSHLPKPNQV